MSQSVYNPVCTGFYLNSYFKKKKKKKKKKKERK